MAVLQRLSDTVQHLIDAFEDALDVFPDDEPIPYECVEAQ